MRKLEKMLVVLAQKAFNNGHVEELNKEYNDFKAPLDGTWKQMHKFIREHLSLLKENNRDGAGLDKFEFDYGEELGELISDYVEDWYLAGYLVDQIYWMAELITSK